ncbi:MAG: hypothetical protein ACI4PL_05340 [Faecousia sp.]
MKNKIILALTVCILLAAFALGSANLVHFTAPSDSGEQETGSDRLVGALITEEYLDLFDAEGYFSDHLQELASGKEITEAESARYQGRLYAVLQNRGTPSEEYVFEGVSGIPYFAAYMENGTESYWSVKGSEAICDGKTHFSSTDQGEGITLEGTIYCSTGGPQEHFYINPVYQTPDGQIYAVSGSGISFGGEKVPGMAWNQELTSSVTTTSGKEQSGFSSSVKINLCYVDEPRRIALLQFNSRNELISRVEYAPEAVPQTLDPLPEAEYLIVETTRVSLEGTEYTSRALFQREDSCCESFFQRPDGLCIRRESQLNWNNS